MAETAYRELLLELERIGKQKAPLDPDGLIGRPSLLTSAGVVRVAGDDATETELAESASTAIRAEIEAIRDPEDRLIARAMFAVSDSYQGKNVGERKERLEDQEGILPSRWDSRRKPILQRIAFGLSQSTRLTEHVRSHDDGRTARPPGKPFVDYRAISRTNQALNAAILHYAGLTTLFARAYDEAISAATHTSRFGHHLTTNYLFNAYVAFVYDGVPYSRAEVEGDPPPSDLSDEDLAPFGSMEEARAWLLARDGLPLDVVERLLRLRAIVSHYSCLAPSTVSNKTQQALENWAGALRFRPRGVSEITKALPVATLEGDRSELFNRLDKPLLAHGARCYKRWHEWLKNAPDRDIAHITSASGAYAAMLGSHSVLQTDVSGRALLGAHKALATYYEFDERDPILDGKSLRELADSYFTMTSPMLAKRHK